MKILCPAVLAALLALTSEAQADEAQDFVTANVISTLYHTYAHALIAQSGAPVPGAAEDAADVISVALLNALWEEDAAQSLTALTALSFELAAQENESPAYWATHSLDVDRYYNQVCLFYAAAPEARSTLAEEFAIPAKQAAACVEVYAQAARSWEPVLAGLRTIAPEKSIEFYGDTSADIQGLLASEIADLNAAFALGRPVTLAYQPCGAENAFYAADTATITICTEYVAFLERQAIANNL